MSGKEKVEFDRKEQLILRCDFTEEELKGFSKELARSTAQLAQAEEEKKAAMAQFAERMTGQKALLSGLARKINEGYEMRMVECGIKLDSPIAGTTRVIRLDTGEVVKERAMHADELQRSLELSPDELSNQVFQKVAGEVNSGALDTATTTVRATVSSTPKGKK